MKNIINLRICNKKDVCGITSCFHSKPHENHISCSLQTCFNDSFTTLRVKCEVKKYKLVEIK